MSSEKLPFSTGTLIEVATFRFIEFAPSAASPYTLTSFLPVMSFLIPFIFAGKETEIVAVPSVAFRGPSRGYSIVNGNGNIMYTGYNDIRIFFMRSAVTEIFFSPAGKCVLLNSQ